MVCQPLWQRLKISKQIAAVSTDDVYTYFEGGYGVSATMAKTKKKQADCHRFDRRRICILRGRNGGKMRSLFLVDIVGLFHHCPNLTR